MPDFSRFTTSTALQPVGNLLPEAAADFGLIAGHVGFAQILQARLGPIAHRHHDFFPVHFELARLVELDQALP